MKASSNLCSAAQKHAFTLTELLVVLGITAILGTIAFNALNSAARAKVESVQCMNNHKQIIAAALLYADEFNGLWVPNEPILMGQTDWTMLVMDWDPNNAGNTNISQLSQPQYSKLSPYVQGDPKIYHCPGDHSYTPFLGYRVRSVSMSQAVGTVWVSSGCLVANGPVNGQWLTGNDIESDCQTQWRCYGKNSDFVAPGPAMTWAFCDEHCDSINDAGLAVQCALSGIGADIIDKPANYHNGAASFSFADGHCEMHRWVGPSIGRAADTFDEPENSGRLGNYSVTNATDNTDLKWLQQRTSTKY